MEIHQQLIQYIQENKLVEACQLLQTTVLRNDGLHYQSRLSEIKSMSLKGVIDFKERDNLMNQIRNAIIQAAQALEEADQQHKERNTITFHYLHTTVSGDGC